VEIIGRALDVYARALAKGSTEGLLAGPPSAPVYRRRNDPR